MGYMLIASVAYSVIPLVVNLAGGSHAPFLFNAWLRMGVAGACLLFLLVFFRSGHLRGGDVVLVWKRFVVWPASALIILAVAGSLDYALFAWSIRFIDITVAAILFEMYPVGIMLFAAWLFRGETRYRWRRVFPG